MRALILALCVSSIAPLALAQVRSAGAATARVTPFIPFVGQALNFADRIQLATQSEVETFKKLNLRIGSRDHSLCTAYHGEDMSGCTKTLIRSLTAHSANSVRAMLDLPVTAAMKDREHGVGDKRAGILLADDFMTIVEGLSPQKFFAHTVLASSKRDRDEKGTARLSENRLLEEFRMQALPTLEAHLAKTELIRASSDPDILIWERIKIQELHTRLYRLKSRRWKID